MTDTALLEHEIEMSGLKKAFIATRLGMTPQTFRSKSINNSDFTTSEVNKLCILLGINDPDKKEQIFLPRMLPTNEQRNTTNEQRNIIMEQETNKKWLSTHSAADMFDFSYGYMARRLLDMRKNPKYVNAFVGKGRNLRVNAEKLEQYLKEEE